MQNKKIRPLRIKIAITIISIVAVALILMGAVFLFGTGNISKTFIESNRKMAATSKSTSSISMNSQTSVRLQELAENTASLADRTFYEFRQAVVMIASAAEKLYEDMDSFPQRTILPPDASKDGTLSLQVL